MDQINPIEVRMASEMVLQQNHCHIPDQLPPLASFVPKFSGQIFNRLACLTAIVQLYFDMTPAAVLSYLEKHDLRDALAVSEEKLLSEPITTAHLKKISWQIESIWAFMWAFQSAEEFDFKTRAPNELFTRLPNIWQSGSWEGFQKNELRAVNALYQMLDFYYRLHFHCVQAAILKEQNSIELGVVAERRRALHWIMHPDMDWDAVDLRFHFADQRKSSS